MIGKIMLFIIAVAMYFLLCYYIGRKLKYVFINNNMKFSKYIHWPIYWFIATSYIISTILKIKFGTFNFITVIGIVYISMFIYCIIGFLLVDILRFILKKININESAKGFLKKVYLNGLSVFILALVIVLYGFFNVQNKYITNYEVNINKNAGAIKGLNIVMVSDVHLGIEVKESKVDALVDSINSLNPDLVVFCGDIYDESTYLSLKEYSSQRFKSIKSKYGVYAIPGNHEYFTGDVNEIISYYEKGNIRYLKDEALKVGNSFYIVGRDDKAGENVTKEKRKPLKNILKEANNSLPIIALNHRPEDIEEAIKENVDLQLSGHTHKGQVFPGGIVTSLLNEKDYGYLKKGNFNLIVSSGYGTWAFPIRIGSKCEIVNVQVNFK